MLPKNIPDDINIELLLSLFPEGQCKVSFTGTHNRNIYNDFMGLEELTDNTMMLKVGRASLYNALPELLFHPINRFDDQSLNEDKEKFEQELDAQEQEKEQAQKFFAPFDLMLLQLRMRVREEIDVYAETDKVIIDIIGDEITHEQKQNRFIKKTLPFLPICKSIRGDKTFLTLMLRKVLMEEHLSVEITDQKHCFADVEPKYNTQLGDDDSIYLDNEYEEQATIYKIHYWPEEECDEHFQQLLEELEIFRQFVQDYFISVDGILKFDVSCDSDCVVLSDDTEYHYMNYNMNI